MDHEPRLHLGESGWFNVRRERLAIETAQLEEQKRHLEQRLPQLEERNRRLESENALATKEWHAIKFLAKQTYFDSFAVQVAFSEDVEFFKVMIDSHSNQFGHSTLGRVCSEHDPRIGDVLERLKDIPHLTSLTIRNVELKANDIERIGELEQLESLWLYANNVTDNMLPPLSQLKRLTNIGIPGNPIRRPKALASLPSLRRLYLRDSDIDDEGLACLTGTPIVRLTLDKTAITDEGVAHLNDLPQMVVVSVMDTAVTADGLKDLDNAHNSERHMLAGISERKSL